MAARFAKQQLEKHGWSEGRGLGATESGRSDAVKVKLKFDTKGLGDESKEFRWWDHAFNKAATNIDVQVADDAVVVKSKTKRSEALSTRPPVQKMRHLLYGNFIKSTPLGSTVAPATEETVSETHDYSKVVADDDLLKACDGLTGHKAARHGLTLKGKLLRLEQADRQLAKDEQDAALKLSGTKRAPRLDGESQNDDEQDGSEEGTLARIPFIRDASPDAVDRPTFTSRAQQFMAASAPSVAPSLPPEAVPAEEDDEQREAARREAKRIRKEERRRRREERQLPEDAVSSVMPIQEQRKRRRGSGESGEDEGPFADVDVDDGRVAAKAKPVSKKANKQASASALSEDPRVSDAAQSPKKKKKHKHKSE